MVTDILCTFDSMSFLCACNFIGNLLIMSVNLFNIIIKLKKHYLCDLSL